MVKRMTIEEINSLNEDLSLKWTGENDRFISKKTHSHRISIAKTGLNRVASEKTKLLISEAQKKFLSENPGNYERLKSQLKVANTRNKQLGIKRKSRKKIDKSDAEMEPLWAAAKKAREEKWAKGLKANLSIGMTGRKHSEETKEKMRLAHIGKKLTDGHKKKLSISHIGQIVSLQTRLKISETCKEKRLNKSKSKGNES